MNEFREFAREIFPSRRGFPLVPFFLFFFFEAGRVYGTSKTVMAMNGGHRESKGTHSNLLIGTITYAIVFSSGKYRPFLRFVLGLHLFAAPSALIKLSWRKKKKERKE